MIKNILFNFLLLISLMSSSNLIAQIPTFEWGVSAGGATADEVNSMTTDINGNVYNIGYFEGTVDFDPSIGVQNLVSNGGDDIFIQKLSPQGNLIWAKQIGGTGDDGGMCIKNDNQGNLYLTGRFRLTVDFNPNAGIANLTSNGGFDAFLLKLDTNGNFLWVKQSRSSGWVEGVSIALDNFRNIYVTGYFDGTADFDPGSAVQNLTSKGFADTFIQKFDVNGNLIWVKQISGSDSEIPESIILDNNHNLYTIGTFKDTIDLDPSAATLNFISNGVHDIFIQKLDSSGNLIWAKQFGGSSFDYGFSIALDMNNNLYTTGTFSNTVDFDPDTGNFSLTSSGFNDTYIQKLDSNGNFIWVNQYGGSGFEEGNSITTDFQGNVYLTGSFSQTVDFDAGVGVYNLTSGFSSDAYILKINGNGNLIWVQQIEGSGSVRGKLITTNTSGDVISSGLFTNIVDLDSDTGTYFRSSNGNVDFYIQKLNQCLNTFGTSVQSACGSYTWIDGITYFSSDSIATYTLTNSKGCDSIVTLSLTIFNVSDITITQNGSALAANNANASGYQWLDCNSSMGVISGETSQSFVPTTNGSYAVELLENGCLDTSACIFVSTVSLKEISYQSELNVYPNPTKDQVTLMGKALNNEAQLFSISGQLVKTYAIDQNAFQQTIDLENVDAGVYFLSIIGEDEKQTVKIVKE